MHGRSLKSLFFSILILLVFDFFASNAQNAAFLVKDINTVPGTTTTTGSRPILHATLHGIVYFVADDGVHGNELWRTDGTEAGTYIVKDINPGSSGSFISELVVVNELLFFPAGDSEHGKELWKSDGTDDGTTLVADIFPGSFGSIPERLTTDGEIVFFSASTAAVGKELWRSDGSANGTQLVKDINPGSAGSDPDMLRYADGNIYFGATTVEYGHELWRSNGEIGNADLVVDAYPGAQGVTINALFEFDGKIIFTTIVQQYYQGELQTTFQWGKLWALDLAIPHVEVVDDLTVETHSYTSGRYPSDFKRHGDLIFYVASSPDDPTELVIWRTDGTTLGTKPVEDVPEKTRYALGLVSYHDHLYFVFPAEGGSKLMFAKTDGTAEGTTIISEISGLGGPTIRATVVDDKCYFIGSGLVQTDGTAEGTKSITSRSAHSYLASENRLYLSIDFDHGLGPELYLFDEHASELRLVKDIRQTTVEGSASPSSFYEYDSKLHFVASDGVNRGLWLSDGTLAGTTSLLDENVDSFGKGNDVLFFSSAANLYTKESDEVTLIKIFPNDAPPGYVVTTSVGRFIPYEGMVFMLVRHFRYFPGLPTSTASWELWRSDGTETGTFFIDHLYQVERYVSAPVRLFKGKLFFFNSNGLMQTDGTLDGTQLVKDVFPSPSGLPMAEMGGNLYFVGANEQLWRTDGSSANTFQVGNIQPFALNTKYLTTVKSTLFFTTDDGINGPELWKSDGTDAGTVLLKNISPDNHLGFVNLDEPKNLRSINDSLYFSANDGVHGYELWKSDGTADGTILAKDLIPGKIGSSPGEFVEVNGRILFIANQFDDSQTVIEDDYAGTGDPKVWELSNGNARVVTGDYQLAKSLFRVDNTIFFSAASVLGRELWTYLVPNIVTSVEPVPDRLQAYPNPTSGSISIFLSGTRKNLQYHVIDMLGRVLLTGVQEANDKLSVDLSVLPAGSYIVRFPESHYKPVRIVKY